MKKTLFRLAFYLSALCLFSAGIAAQDPAPVPPQEPPAVEKAQAEEQGPANPCPRITLKAPSQPIREGTPIKLTASLTGGDKKVEPIFDWSISAGMIRSGQGTTSIEVDTSGAGSERSIHATLLVGGYPGECTASETALIPVAGPASLSDEFGALPDAELATRIESLIASVPAGDQVYVMAYAGRTNIRGYASATLRQIRTVAIRSGIPSDKLVTVDGGYREEPAFEFWLVPVGAEAPAPTPSISAKDIVFPKAAAKAKKP